MILLNVLLFLVISAVARRLLRRGVVVTGLPSGPTPVVESADAILVAGIVVFRLSFTSFQLPRKTQLPAYSAATIGTTDFMLVVMRGRRGSRVTAFTATFLHPSSSGTTHSSPSPIIFASGPYLLAFITMFWEWCA